MSLPLYACGSNGSSQLSLNHNEDVYTLQQCIFHPSVPLATNIEIIDLVSASTHSLLLLRTPSGNILLGSGTNTLGQLGPRCALWDEVKPEARFKPVDMIHSAGIEDIWEPVKVAVTWTTSFVVYQKLQFSQEVGGSGNKEKEEVQQVLLACGSNDFGELGIASKGGIARASDNPTVVDIGLKWGDRVNKIKGGQRHVVAVITDKKEEQRVVGWGASRKGELDASSSSKTPPTRTTKGKGKGKMQAYPSTLPPTAILLDIPSDVSVSDIALGASHTLLLLSSGSIIAWGSDAKGQIGGLDEVKDGVGVAATWGGSYILRRNGSVWSQGSNSHGQLLRETNADNGLGQIHLNDGIRVKQVVAGSEHLLVIGSNGHTDILWVGGWNEHGNLGFGDQLDRPVLTKMEVPGRPERVWGGLAATWVSFSRANNAHLGCK